MAFTWKEISQYIDRKQIEEMRTNLNNLDANIACITHDYLYCLTQNETIYPTVKSTNCGGHYLGHDGSDRSSHEGGHNGGYNSGHKRSHDGSHDSTFQNGYLGGYYPTYYGNDHCSQIFN